MSPFSIEFMQEKYTIHVDMSQKFYEKYDVGIAFIATEDRTFHKGTALSNKLIKSLNRDLNADYDSSRLYAICIYWILKEDISKSDNLIICNDEPFEEVQGYLNLLFNGNSDFDNVSMISLRDHTQMLGKNIQSLAHGVANSYRKRGLKRHRHNRGKKLNFIELHYEDIVKLWKIVDNNLKPKN